MLKDKTYGPKFRAAVRADLPGGPVAARVPAAGRPDRGQPGAARDQQAARLPGGRPAGPGGGLPGGDRLGVAAHIPGAGRRRHRVSAGGAAPAPGVPLFLLLGAVQPAVAESGTGAAGARPGRGSSRGTFTAAEAEDLDGLLAAPPAPATAAARRPADRRTRTARRSSTRSASRCGPARNVRRGRFGCRRCPSGTSRAAGMATFPTVVELVDGGGAGRGSVDYGQTPGLAFPVALVDRPRDHRQEVHCLDLLSDNALIICAPQRGATTAAMTMVTAGALMYRPERVQFYCVAASGPQLAQLSELPHVAAVAGPPTPRVSTGCWPRWRASPRNATGSSPPAGWTCRRCGRPSSGRTRPISGSAAGTWCW